MRTSAKGKNRRGRHTAKPRRKKNPLLGRTSNRRPIPLSKLSDRSQAARDRALHALSDMRNDPQLLLTRATRQQGVKPETVKKYFPSALKVTNGRLRVTKSDRYAATLYVPDDQGNSIPVRTRSSKEREQLSQYLRDLGRSLRGDRRALSRWRGKKIAGVELFTDESALVSIEPALSEFSLYRIFNS